MKSSVLQNEKSEKHLRRKTFWTKGLSEIYFAFNIPYKLLYKRSVVRE